MPGKQGRKRRAKEMLDAEADVEDYEGMDDMFLDSVAGKVGSGPDSSSDEDPYADETAAERRIRLAKEVLAEYELEEDSQDEGSGPEVDMIGNRLQHDVLKSKGKHVEKYAEQMLAAGLDQADGLCVRILRGHKRTPTAAQVTADGSTVYSAAKDRSILRWDVETGQKTWFSRGARQVNLLNAANNDEGLQYIEGHTDEILSLSVSTDGNMLATGSRDMTIRIWDTRLAPAVANVHTFHKHRDAVSAVKFQYNSKNLFSGSFDRQMQFFNCSTEPPMLVQTMYGHTSRITGIDCLARDRAMSCGYDKSVRQWKIVTDTQLLFKQVNKCSVDGIAMLNDQRFVTVSQDGSMNAWTTLKKKPSHTVPKAHGGEWLSAVAAVKYSDVIATGSCNGQIKLWRWLDDDKRKDTLKNMGALTVNVTGHINDLSWSDDGRILVAAVGKEQRLGRWNPIKTAKDGIVIVRMQH